MADPPSKSRQTRMPVAKASSWIISIYCGRYTASFVLICVLVVVTAVIPSLQVLFVGRMVAAVAQGKLSLALRWGIIAGIVVGGYLALEQLKTSAMIAAQHRLKAWALQSVDETLSTLSPRRVASESVQRAEQATRADIEEGNLSYHFVATFDVAFAAVMVLTLCISIGQYSFLAALFVVACLLPMSLSASWYGAREGNLMVKRAEASRKAKYRENLLRYQTTATELAALGARRGVAEDAATYVCKSEATSVKLARLGARADALAGAVSALLLVGAFAALILADANASSIAGGAVGVLSAITATASLGYSFGSLRTGANAVGRFLRFRVLQEPPLAIGTSQETVDSLKVDELTVRYPNASSPAVERVSLIAHRGEMIAIVGPNGAGKTTLIRGILGVIRSQSGQVLIDEHDVSDVDFAHRRHLFGILSQEFGRYEFTIRENLSLGQRGPIGDDELWDALEKAQAADFVRDLPGKLDSQLGEQWGGVGLSCGQWQRLALARLILLDRPIWILGEPTSSIDAEAEGAIFDQLGLLANGHITVLVSHRASTLRNTSRIYVIDHASVVEEGTYDSLIANSSSRFAKLFRSQRLRPTKSERELD